MIEYKGNLDIYGRIGLKANIKVKPSRPRILTREILFKFVCVRRRACPLEGYEVNNDGTDAISKRRNILDVVFSWSKVCMEKTALRGRKRHVTPVWLRRHYKVPLLYTFVRRIKMRVSTHAPNHACMDTRLPRQS